MVTAATRRAVQALTAAEEGAQDVQMAAAPAVLLKQVLTAQRQEAAQAPQQEPEAAEAAEAQQAFQVAMEEIQAQAVMTEAEAEQAVQS